MIRCTPAALLALALTALPACADALLEQAKADFMTLCAPCHGDDGRGHGPKAASLSAHPADLTQIAVRYGSFPEDKVFATIAGLDMPEGHGTRAMPTWGDVFLTEGVGKSTTLADAMKASDDASRRIAALVRYIASIQAAP